MQRFSITQLETARRDPVRFAKVLKDGNAKSPGFGYPKSLRWLDAVCSYHSTSDISAGIRSLEEGFSNRKDTAKNRREVESFINALSNYENYVTKSKLSMIKSRQHVDLPLTKELKITGQIPIILMKPQAGFSAYFLQMQNNNWLSELKYPVIQDYIATKIFSCDPELVDVGYIDFSNGTVYSNSYRVSELTSYKRELNRIGKKISINL